MYNKPPLGVMPKNIWDKKRYDNLCEAIGRFIVCGKAAPEEWVEEARTLKMDHPEFG